MSKNILWALQMFFEENTDYCKIIIVSLHLEFDKNFKINNYTNWWLDKMCIYICVWYDVLVI